MRLRDQRGQTLIELLIGIAVTGLVLTALGGLLYTVSDRFAAWGNRLDSATDGFDLAATLQSDSHRYVPCGLSGGSQLTLCPTTNGCLSTDPLAVHYNSQAPANQGGRVVVTRTVGNTSKTATRVGTFDTPITFTFGAGAIQVWGQENEGLAQELIVYYRAPVPKC